jgi:nucleoside-diphosphate-sugar epimerase
MSKDSILVTGAGGFVGKALVEALRRRGEHVITHTRANGDITQTPLTATGVRHVYHLAARTYVPDSWNDPEPFYRVNVLGAAGVMEYCRKNTASVTMLSSYVYGHPKQLPIGEDHPLQAFNPYSHSKILAEEIGQFYQSAFGVAVTVVRAFNLYGPGQPSHFLIPTLITQALSLEGETIVVEDADPRRDYIFISDLVDLLERFSGGGRSGIYNAGSGVSTSVQEVANLIIELTGTSKRFVSRGTKRPDEVNDTVADISRAAKEFRWAPAISLKEGLRIAIQSMRRTAEGDSR